MNQYGTPGSGGRDRSQVVAPAAPTHRPHAVKVAAADRRFVRRTDGRQFRGPDRWRFRRSYGRLGRSI
ncbi:hypothetical protein [Fodinicola feengrottensis]|uniref:hypothetical protein n=1 Tax=Fodinicola feengrottensis TaxID=435914 RepID=UPI0013D310B0|nr:hypothetical protein [Fodinicola feengrottensis]